jgi:putative ABC transport system permease protein
VSHGTPGPDQEADVHDEKWTVVGRLEKTGTAVDRVIFVPLTTFYCIPDHEEGLSAQAMIRAGIDPAKINATPPPPEPKSPTTAAAADDHDDHDDHDLHDDHDDHDAHDDHGDSHAGHDHHHDHVYHMNDDGTVELHMPKDQWALSAILVKARGGEASGPMVLSLLYLLGVKNEVLAVNPASVMREFFETFLRGSTMVLLMVSALVTIVAAVGILVSIYNSVAARRREIAILRALGATRAKVLSIICLEAGLIGVLGGLLGLVLGHAVAAVGSKYLDAYLGQSMRWTVIDGRELLYLVGVIILATLAGLVPAAAAYKTPVATNLVPS